MTSSKPIMLTIKNFHAIISPNGTSKSTVANVPASALALIFAFWIGMPVLPAHGCSCGLSYGGEFVAPKDGRLPANAVGIVWYEHNLEHLARFTVEVREEGTFRELPVTVAPVKNFLGAQIIAPVGGLKTGATYRFTAAAFDWSKNRDEQVRVQVTVDSERLSAQTAFALNVSPVTTDSIGVAMAVSCRGRLLAARADIKTRLPSSAQRWREQLLYRTQVDGDDWYASDGNCSRYPPGRSWQGAGHDRVYAACQEAHSLIHNEGVEPGRHTVTMQAFLPGTDVVLEAAGVVDLSCS